MILWLLTAYALTPQEQADALALQNDDEVQECLEEAPEDSLTVKFKLKGGKLLGFKVIEGSEAAGSCLWKVMSRWRWPSAVWGPVPALTVRREAAIPDEAVIEATVRAKTPTLKICYDEALEADAELAGRLLLTWTVEGGEVSEVSVREDEVGSESLTECVVQMVEGWDFPATVSTTVSWPFSFAPRGGDPSKGEPE